LLIGVNEQPYGWFLTEYIMIRGAITALWTRWRQGCGRSSRSFV